jgi:hypothetical protein
MTESLGKQTFGNGGTIGLPSNDTPLISNSESEILMDVGVTVTGPLEFKNIPSPNRQKIDPANAIKLHIFAFMITSSMEI